MNDQTSIDLYAENVNGQRCSDVVCKDTDKYSLTMSIIHKISASADWQTAIGSANGDKIFETSLYKQGSENARWTIGVGHNFDSGQSTARIGVLADF